MSTAPESIDHPVAAPDWLIEIVLKKPGPEPPAQNAQTSLPDSTAADRYVSAAVRNEVRRVSAAREGARNATLNNAALALGHFVGAGLLPRSTVEQELRRAATDCGLWRDGPHAVEATIRSGLSAGMAQPFDLSRLREGRQQRSNGGAATGETYDRETGEILSDDAISAIDLSRYEQNDIGNAQRLIDQYGKHLRYVVNVGWHAWDGKRWRIDAGDVAVRRYAHRVAKAILAEVAHLADPKMQEARAKWSISSGYTARISGMMLQAEPHLALTADDLDRDPWLLTVNNGTIDLHDGTLRPHDPADLITKLAPVEFDPLALCPTWERFLESTFAGDRDLIEFMQRALGYSLTGITREHVIFICHGSGSNGKSVLLETIASILDDYTRQCPSDTFTAKDKTGSGISNDIARLAGARLVAVVETDQEKRLAEGLVKQATGGDRMAARYLHHEFFEFTPKFKLWLATNHKPSIRGTDHGIWRRIRLLPFNVTFHDPDKAEPGTPTKDDRLKDKLLAELPGILAFMVRGCLTWQATGLGSASAVDIATTAYRDQQDRIGGFIADRCDVSPSYSCKFSDLYDGYKRWCGDNGDTPIAGKTFADRLDEKGFPLLRGAHGVRFREGIALKPAPISDDDRDQ